MKIQLMRSSAIAALVMLGLLGSVGLDYLDLGMAQSQPIYSQQTPMNSIPTVDERLVTANTQFGFNLFSQLSQQEGEKISLFRLLVLRSRFLWLTTGQRETRNRQWLRR
uniref:Uncharacterized protein n=1 Tax=Desertifilum tharense IPPAS B-1220 TaxID=1781255 RepID=A0ACD5GU90_9CYAN